MSQVVWYHTTESNSLRPYFVSKFLKAFYLNFGWLNLRKYILSFEQIRLDLGLFYSGSLEIGQRGSSVNLWAHSKDDLIPFIEHLNVPITSRDRSEL